MPTAVHFGSLDSDSFSFDPNTARLTGSTFNLGAKAVVGALTWNANGAMQKMQITDPLNSADSQTCTYIHDDESRIAGANCGTAWAQTFSYDAFGNVSKNGSITFQPTYSATTNRITSLPGFTPTYDANGNSLNDSFHIYVLDAENHAVKVDLVNMTYDALGRMVEQNRSGVYMELVYGPGGAKLALMNGQSLVKAFVGLPANATAIYNSAGLAYYRHADWLGSSRLASTPARTMYSDTAYAPFGEPYAQAGTTDASFTGQNQDTVTGLYDFLAREHSSTQGRWTSPDPYRGSYDITNPQSMNRYAYVLNNPLVFVDPLGLQTSCIDDGVDIWCTWTPDPQPIDPPCGDWCFIPYQPTPPLGPGPGRPFEPPNKGKPLSRLDKVGMYAGCIAGMDPNDAKPLDLNPSPAIPLDPLNSTEGTSGQRTMYGPGRGARNGGSVPYNPSNNSLAPDAAAGGTNYLVNVIQCIINVNTAWPK